jgi:Tol biopolymer transport system component
VQDTLGHLSVIHPDGSGLRRVSVGTYEEVGSQGTVADWSIDETALVFSAGDPNQVRDVYLVTLAGGAEREISPDGAFCWDPVFSPDSSQIAYLCAGAGLGPIVQIADATGTFVRALPGHYGWAGPIWAPDGTRLLVYDDRPGPADAPGSPVLVLLDPLDEVAPLVIEPPPGSSFDVRDDFAAAWQRMAPP